MFNCLLAYFFNNCSAKILQTIFQNPDSCLDSIPKVVDSDLNLTPQIRLESDSIHWV